MSAGRRFFLTAALEQRPREYLPATAAPAPLFWIHSQRVGIHAARRSFWPLLSPPTGRGSRAPSTWEEAPGAQAAYGTRKGRPAGPHCHSPALLLHDVGRRAAYLAFPPLHGSLSSSSTANLESQPSACSSRAPPRTCRARSARLLLPPPLSEGAFASEQPVRG